MADYGPYRRDVLPPPTNPWHPRNLARYTQYGKRVYAGAFGSRLAIDAGRALHKKFKPRNDQVVVYNNNRMLRSKGNMSRGYRRYSSKRSKGRRKRAKPRYKKRSTRNKSNMMKKVLDLISPRIKGQHIYVNSYNVLKDTVGWHEPPQSLTLGSLQQLKDFWDYYHNAAVPTLDLANLWQKLNVSSITQKFTISNPGNAKIRVRVQLLRFKKASGTAHRPVSVMADLSGDVWSNPANIAGIRNTLTYTDPMFDTHMVPEFKNMFAVEQTHSFLLKPDEHRSFFGKCRAKNFKASDQMMSGQHSLPGYSKIWLVRVQGIMASDAGGANLGLSACSYEVQYRTYVTMRKQIATVPTVGTLIMTDESLPASGTPAIFTAVNAQTPVVAK